MSIFGERLKELIEDSNLTVTKLAKVSGITQSKLSNWTRYDIMPATKSVIEVAGYFNCPVDFLLGRTETVKANFSQKPDTCSDRLKVLIRAKNITQYRACAELHIDTAMMTAWTKNGTLPSCDNLILLADYFDCSVDYLLGLSNGR